MPLLNPSTVADDGKISVFGLVYSLLLADGSKIGSLSVDRVMVLSSSSKLYKFINLYSDYHIWFLTGFTQPNDQTTYCDCFLL